MLAISFTNRSGLPPSELAELGRRAEAAGISHVVYNESYNDVIAYLVALAGATNRATLCSGIANVGFRHPVLMAMGAATVDEVSGGRLVLGLGTGTQWYTAERLDTLEARPLQMLREYVAVVRAVLSGERVNLPGPRYPVHDFQLSFRPVRRDVPIYLAVVGRKMAELAGEIADGIIVNMNGPEDFPAIQEHVARGCERAGRDPSGVTIGMLISTTVDGDVDRAREAVRAWIPAYLKFDGYSRHVASLGYGTVVAEARRCLQAGDAAGAARAVPDELVERVGAYGPPERCREKVEAFRRAGVDLPVIAPRTVDTPWRTLYERTIDAFAPAARPTS